MEPSERRKARKLENVTIHLTPFVLLYAGSLCIGHANKLRSCFKPFSWNSRAVASECQSETTEYEKSSGSNDKRTRRGHKEKFVISSMSQIINQKITEPHKAQYFGAQREREKIPFDAVFN